MKMTPRSPFASPPRLPGTAGAAQMMKPANSVLFFGARSPIWGEGGARIICTRVVFARRFAVAYVASVVPMWMLLQPRARAVA